MLEKLGMTQVTKREIAVIMLLFGVAWWLGTFAEGRSSASAEVPVLELAVPGSPCDFGSPCVDGAWSENGECVALGCHVGAWCKDGAGCNSDSFCGFDLWAAEPCKCTPGIKEPLKSCLDPGMVMPTDLEMGIAIQQAQARLEGLGLWIPGDPGQHDRLMQEAALRIGCDPR